MNNILLSKISEDRFLITYRDLTSRDTEVERVNIVKFLDECIDALMGQACDLDIDEGFGFLETGV